MLHLLDRSLETFLRAVVPLRKQDTTFTFKPPDAELRADLPKGPTVDLFLWDVRPNLSEAEYGFETVTVDGDLRARRTSRPRIDCRYLLTVWSSDVDDEHRILGDLMTALLSRTQIEAEYLDAALRDITPLPGIVLRSGTGSENSDFWSALGGQLKPGLDLVVTVTVDAAISHEPAPDIDQVTYRPRLRDQSGDTESSWFDRAASAAEPAAKAPKSR